MNPNAFWCIPLLLVAWSSQASEQDARNFAFGPAHEPGQTRVSSDAVYTPALGYGFEPSAAPDGEKPFLFSIRIPEGNYNITLTLGGADPNATTTVRAESRRLMLESVPVHPGESRVRTFTVNVRTSKIVPGGEVKLKERESGTFTWDDKLTLEFNGGGPSIIRGVRITPAPADTVTVYLAGDSTVTDQADEPWAAWGQMLPRFFKVGVAVANHAESGESLRSFRGARRLDKILSTIKAGDYLFIQFGHNDQKLGPTHVEPFTMYKQGLADYVAAARAKGATPVLVTPMHRRTFGRDGRLTNSHGDYPQAVRQLAREQNVPLIDLHATSQRLFNALGEEASKRAFVHYPANAFPGQNKPLTDNTHFSAYGAYLLARSVIEEIRTTDLPLKHLLIDDLPEFNLDAPDPVINWKLPPSPTGGHARIPPAGR